MAPNEVAPPTETSAGSGYVRQTNKERKAAQKERWKYHVAEPSGKRIDERLSEKSKSWTLRQIQQRIRSLIRRIESYRRGFRLWNQLTKGEQPVESFPSMPAFVELIHALNALKTELNRRNVCAPLGVTLQLSTKIDKPILR